MKAQRGGERKTTGEDFMANNLAGMVVQFGVSEDTLYNRFGEQSGRNLVGAIADAKKEVESAKLKLRGLQSAGSGRDILRIREAEKVIREAKKAEAKAIEAFKKAIAEARAILDEAAKHFAAIEAAVASGDYEVVLD